MTSTPSQKSTSPVLPTMTSSLQRQQPGESFISIDRGLGDIPAHPLGSHAGIIVLRLTDQSAATVTKAIGDLASLPELDNLTGTVTVMQRGLLRIRHP
jgi:hypothetical protein